MNTNLAVADEPVELCVTRLRYAQVHGFLFPFDFSARRGARKWVRAVYRMGQSTGVEPSGHSIPSEPQQKSLVAPRQSGHPSNAQRPAIRVSLAGHPSCRATAGSSTVAWSDLRHAVGPISATF